VLRQSESLDALLARFISRGINSVAEPLLDVLRVGAYQLRFLDRVPPHAAVATTVALARELVNERSAGFVNAVLRKVAAIPRDARDAMGSVVGAQHAAPLHRDSAADPVSRVPRPASHPAWLVDRWTARFGPDATAALLAWNNTQPSLVLQPTGGTLHALTDLLRAHGIGTETAPFDAGVIVAESHPERLPGFDTGDFFVQDPAQALVVRFADFPVDTVVYDACSAPGGKMLGLSARSRYIIAADRSRPRLRRLAENIARAGRGREHVIAADAAHPPIRRVAAYLLDAPCLGTGSFARHPDARLRVTLEALQQLAAAQRLLLDAAAERIAPGGVLCYATCSLEPEENEMQVHAFLERHPEFRRKPPTAFPQTLLTSDGDLLTLPQRDRIDGAFAARLVRNP
jgi:16S rRNA (cytosine967-C5)-methyltransferase